MPPLDLQVLVVEDHAFQLAVAVSVLISAVCGRPAQRMRSLHWP